jgi:uncharacterized protein (DUF58 family)
MVSPPQMNPVRQPIDPDDLAKTAHLELLSKLRIDGLLSGRHRSKTKGGCAEFAEHRAYSPGDEIRLLDWRVFARSDRYVIKQYEEEISLQALVAIDASGSMGFGVSTVSKYDYAKAAALCLARVVLGQRDSAGLAVMGGGLRSFIPPRSRASHLEVIRGALEGNSPVGPTTMSDDLGQVARRIKRRGLVLLFSDCFDSVERLAKSLKLLRSRRHEVLLFHVLAPEEISFSFRRWTRFEPMEAGVSGIDLDPLAVRALYLARLKTFLARVRQICTECSCDYIPMSTGRPVGDTLADYLRRRMAATKL